MMSQRWMFTLKNYVDREVDLMLSSIHDSSVYYAIIGAGTAPSTGTPHLQGYINLCRKRRPTGVKEFLGTNRVDVQPFFEGDLVAKSYCEKGEVILELGDPLPGRGSHKRRLMERYNEEPDELLLEDPNKFKRCVARAINDESRNWYLNNDFPHEMRPWQFRLTVYLANPPDDRLIHWVYGPYGGEGKTCLAKYLACKSNWFYTPGGNTRNIVWNYMKNPRRNLIMDVPRCHSKHINYGVLEMIKNRAFPGKYESSAIVDMQNVHVVVMANVMPDLEKISCDRIVLVCCNE